LRTRPSSVLVHAIAIAHSSVNATFDMVLLSSYRS
jgi:hypothetical protein